VKTIFLFAIFISLVGLSEGSEYKVVIKKTGKIVSGTFDHEDENSIFLKSGVTLITYKKEILDLEKMKDLNSQAQTQPSNQESAAKHFETVTLDSPASQYNHRTKTESAYKNTHVAEIARQKGNPKPVKKILTDDDITKSEIIEIHNREELALVVKDLESSIQNVKNLEKEKALKGAQLTHEESTNLIEMQKDFAIGKMILVFNVYDDYRAEKIFEIYHLRISILDFQEQVEKEKASPSSEKKLRFLQETLEKNKRKLAEAEKSSPYK